MFSVRTLLLSIIILASVYVVSIQPAEAAPTVPKWAYRDAASTEIADPINVIFYGYGKAWWIEEILTITRGWDQISICGGSLYVNSRTQNSNLEHPRDSCPPVNWPINSERTHLRIWDMGYSSEWGYWAVGGVHFEAWNPNNPLQFHTISTNGWERAEQKLLDHFKIAPQGFQAIDPSATRIWIDNKRDDLQGSSNDGYAIFVKIPTPGITSSGVQGCPSSGLRRPKCIMLSPYLQTWTGTDYQTDNNLMPFSEGMGGIEVTDYYRVQSQVAETLEGYELKIVEIGNTWSFFDQIRLIVVDRPAGTGLSVSPRGYIFTYKNLNSPVSSTDATGSDQTFALSQADGVSYQGTSGGYLTIDFGNSINVSYGVRLLVKADCGLCRKPIIVQVRDSTSVWQNVTITIPRAFSYTEAIDMTDVFPDPFGEFKVRLFFMESQRVDHVALDTSRQEPMNITETTLLHASHSVYGDVTSQVRYSDDIYEDIMDGESIRLVFQAPAASSGIREFLIVSEGRVRPAP